MKWIVGDSTPQINCNIPELLNRAPVIELNPNYMAWKHFGSSKTTFSIIHIIFIINFMIILIIIFVIFKYYKTYYWKYPKPRYTKHMLQYPWYFLKPSSIRSITSKLALNPHYSIRNFLNNLKKLQSYRIWAKFPRAGPTWDQNSSGPGRKFFSAGDFKHFSWWHFPIEIR